MTSPGRARVAVGRDGLLALRGEDLGRSAWQPVTQPMIDAFADVTGDHEWLHVDPSRAASGPYGGTVAHGFLTLSLVPMAMTSLLAVTDTRLRVNYGLNRVRFPAPVPVGSRLRGHVVVTDVVPRDDAIDLI